MKGCILAIALVLTACVSEHTEHLRYVKHLKDLLRKSEECTRRRPCRAPLPARYERSRPTPEKYFYAPLHASKPAGDWWFATTKPVAPESPWVVAIELAYIGERGDAIFQVLAPDGDSYSASVDTSGPYGQQCRKKLELTNSVAVGETVLIHVITRTDVTFTLEVQAQSQHVEPEYEVFPYR